MAASESTGSTHELIELIVREVLAKLGSGQKQNTAKANAGELAVTAKVVTLAELDGRLSGVTQLVVSRGAILTPSVRDLLRQKKIAVAYAAGQQVGANRPRLVVGVTETKYEAAALLRALEPQVGAIERLEAKGLAGSVHELGSRAAAGGQLSLLLTSRAAVAACLANRRPGVRAAVATDVASAAAAVATLGVNLLVVDPANKSLYELIRIGREFLRGGVRDCPAELRESLN